jgi:N-acetylneuraminic acid mutarotase
MKRLLACALLIGCNSSPPANHDGGADAGACAPLALRPSARQRVEGVLAPSIQKILVYGGDGAPISTALPAPRQLGDDLWAYDVACGTWSELGTQQPPGAQGEYAATLDSKRNRLILIAGQKGTTKTPPIVDEQWAYDVTAMTWAQLHPAAPAGAPGARVGHRAVYDAAHDRVVMFGGESGTGFNAADMLGDTWVLDFAASADGTWQKLVATGPSARRDAAFASDGLRAVLFGGASDFATYQNDVWVFDFGPGAWKQAATSGDIPSARFASKLAFDATGGRFVMFGGHDPFGLGVLNDTYAITVDANGTNAALKLLIAGDADTTVAGVDHMSPERRERHAQAASGSTLWIFGGASDCGPMDDVWTLDLTAPTAWTPAVPALIDETCQRRAMPGQTCQPPPNDCTNPLCQVRQIAAPRNFSAAPAAGAGGERQDH